MDGHLQLLHFILVVFLVCLVLLVFVGLDDAVLCLLQWLRFFVMFSLFGFVASLILLLIDSCLCGLRMRTFYGFMGCCRLIAVNEGSLVCLFVCCVDCDCVLPIVYTTFWTYVVDAVSVLALICDLTACAFSWLHGGLFWAMGSDVLVLVVLAFAFRWWLD